MSKRGPVWAHGALVDRTSHTEAPRAPEAWPSGAPKLLGLAWDQTRQIPQTAPKNFATSQNGVNR